MMLIKLRSNNQMQNDTISYTTKSYNVGKAFLFALPAFILITLLLLLIALKSSAPAIFIVGWIALMTIPFLFQKKFKLLFTRKIILNFDNENFKISGFGLEDNELKNEFNYRWEDIKSYRCYFSASSVTYITLYLRDGSSKNLSFNDKDQNSAVVEESVFSLFYYFVSRYNTNKDPDDKIVFKPGFFTTSNGLVLIVSLLILAIVLIITHFILHPKSAMMSLMALFIILGLFGKRKKDIMFKDKLENLEPINIL